MLPLSIGHVAANLLVTGPSSVVPVGPIVPGFLELDELGLLFGTTLVVLTILLVLCSPATGQAFRYTALAGFFLLVALGALSAVNVVVFYVGWELTALFAWGLGRLAEDPEAEGVAPFNAAGALASLLMFGGLLLLAARSHTTSLSGLDVAQGGPASLVILAAILLKSFGVLSEIRHDATARQFSLAGASLAGASLLVVGFYPILRFFGHAAAHSPGWQVPAATLAGGLALLAALAALGQDDLRQALAYGALSQFAGFVFAIAVGVPLATQGGVFGVVTYSLAMTGLLLAASLVEAATGQRDLRWLGGLAQRQPTVAALFLLSAFAVAGLPPFGGLVAGGLVATALWQQATPTAAVVWSALSALTLLYLARLFARVFLGELRSTAKAGGPWTVQGAMLALVAGLAIAGLAPDQVMAFVRPALALLAS